MIVSQNQDVIDLAVALQIVNELVIENGAYDDS